MIGYTGKLFGDSEIINHVKSMIPQGFQIDAIDEEGKKMVKRLFEVRFLYTTLRRETSQNNFSRIE